MTPDPTRPDPRRALDGIDPPDRWDDVVARAEQPTDARVAPVLAAMGNRPRRPLLAAAAVLAVIAMVGGIALAVRSGDEDRQGVTAGQGQQDPPTAMWGKTWQVTKIVRNGKDQPVVSARERGKGAVPNGRVPLALDLRSEGVIRFGGCNRTYGEVRLDGDRIEPVGAWDSEKAACSDIQGNPDPLMAQDTELTTFLRSGVEVTVSGEDLTLIDGAGDHIDLVDAKAFDPATAIWNRTWTVSRLIVKGEEEALPKEDVPQLAFTLNDDAKYGHVEVRRRGCADLNIVRLRGATLHDTTVDGAPSAPHCQFPSVVSRISAISGFWGTVEVRGDKLVLRSGTSSIEAFDPAGSGPTAAADPSAEAIGRTWQVTRIDRDGQETPIVPVGSQAPDSPLEPLRLKVSASDDIGFNTCGPSDPASGPDKPRPAALRPLRLVGNRIEPFGSAKERNGCFVSKGTPSTDQAIFVSDFLRSGVDVTVSGQNLTMRNDKGDQIDLVDVKAFDRPSAVWGRTFTVTRLVEEGKELSPETSLGVPAHFRFVRNRGATSGVVETIGQSGSVNRNPVEVRGDLLAAADDPSVNTPVGEFDVAEVATNRILVQQPIIELRGDRLVLRSGTSSIEAVDPAAAPETGAAADPSGVDPNGTPPTGTADDPSALWNRTWTVVWRSERSAGRLPLSDAIGGGRPQLFAIHSGPEGTVRVSGCNETVASVRLVGTVLHFVKQLPSRAVGLSCPSGFGNQDAWFLRLLEASPTVSVRGDRLTLSTADGRRVELRDEAPGGAFAYRQWFLRSRRDASAADLPVVDVRGGGTPFLVLTQTPAATDSATPEELVASIYVTGCNGVGVDVRLEKDRLRFVRPLSATKVRCDDDLMAQDAWFFDLLAASPRWEVDGNQLTLTAANGRQAHFQNR